MLSAFNNTQKGIMFAFLGFTAFACADASSKWLGMHYETRHVLFWTYLISLMFGLGFSPLLGGLKKTIKTTKILIHLGRAFCALAIASLIVSALSRGLPLANLYTVLFLAPFLISIAAAPLYKESVPPRNWLIIALGFSGILIAFRPGWAEIPVEVFSALGALLFIVTLSLLARPLDDKESLLSLSFYPALVVVLVLTPMMWFSFSLPAFEHLPIFIFNGLCVTIGLSAIAYAFRIAPYAVVAPVHYTQMVIALIAGYIVFGDTPDLWMLSGAAIIMISGVLLVMSNKK